MALLSRIGNQYLCYDICLLLLGTRICVECTDPSTCPGVVVDSTSQASSSPYYLHRRDPTGVMRRFTLGRHCRGRAAVIRAGCGDKCGEEGLRFRVVK